MRRALMDHAGHGEEDPTARYSASLLGRGASSPAPSFCRATGLSVVGETPVVFVPSAGGAAGDVVEVDGTAAAMFSGWFLGQNTRGCVS